MNKNKTFKNVPQYLQWQGKIYEFISNKHGILLYCKQGAFHFDDWVDDDEIIVIEHRKDKPLNDAFYVLFNIYSGYYNHSIQTSNISKFTNRLAKPYYKQNK